MFFKLWNFGLVLMLFCVGCSDSTTEATKSGSTTGATKYRTVDGRLLTSDEIHAENVGNKQKDKDGRTVHEIAENIVKIVKEREAREGPEDPSRSGLDKAAVAWNKAHPENADPLKEKYYREQFKGLGFAELISKYKTCCDNKAKTFYHRINIPSGTKEWNEALDEEENKFGLEQSNLIRSLSELVHQLDPDRNKTKEGILLDRAFNIDDDMIERATEVDYEYYNVPKPEKDREWSIAEYKRLHKELDTILSDYLADLDFKTKPTE